jgi:uncharacterized OB-fold protein
MTPPPLPALTEENHAYWTGGARGLLLINRCTACRYWVHPPGPVCPQCHSTDVEPAPVSGLGTIYSYTVNHQRWHPELEVPYAIVVVDLDEQPGLRLTTNLRGCPVDEVRIGMRVRVCFEAYGEIHLPQFRPEPA